MFQKNDNQLILKEIIFQTQPFCPPVLQTEFRRQCAQLRELSGQLPAAAQAIGRTVTAILSAARAFEFLEPAKQKSA
jgi:hypothetical protein